MEFHEEKDDEFRGPSSVTSNGNCEESNSAFSTHEGEICLSVRTSIQVKLNVDLEVLDEIRNKQGSVIGDYTIPTSFRLNTKWIDVLRALQVPYDPEKYVLKGHGRKINIEDTVESFYLMYTRRLPYYTVNLIFAGKDCRKQRQPFPEDSRPSLDTGLLGNLNPNGVRRSTRQKSSLEKKKICSRPDRPKRKSALRRKILSETSTSSEEHDHNGPEQIGTSKCSLSNDVFQTTQTEGTPTKVKKKEWESTLKNGSHSIQSVNLIPHSVSVSPDERGPANLETSNSEKDYSQSTTSLESIPSFSNHDRTQNQPEFLNESIVQVVSEAPETLTHDTGHANDAELIRSKAASANSLPSLSPKDFEEDTTTEKFLSGTEVKCERIEVEVSTSPISETIQMIPPNSLPVTPSATAVTGEDPTALLPLPVDSRVPPLHVEIESDTQVSSQADIEAEPSSSSSHVTAEKFSCLSRPTQEPMDLSIPRSTENLIKQPTPENTKDDCCVISGNQMKSAGDSTVSNTEQQQDILIKPHLLTYINRHYTNRDLNKVYKELRELTEDMQIHQLGTLAPFTSIFLTTIFNNSRILEQLELEPEHPSTSTLQPSVPATPTKDLEGSSESTGDCT